MIYEALKKKYGYNTPIFTKEILEMFPEYTKAYVFRLVNKEIEKGKIGKLDRGIYYIPQKSEIGPTTITPSDAAIKRYIKDGNEINGLFSGITLQNEFYVTTQVPSIREIVTNNETSFKREINIDGVTYILRKSRTPITKDNIDAYRVMQLFSETNDLVVNERAIEEVKDYMKKKKVTKKSLLDLAKYFPGNTMKKMLSYEVI